VGIVKREEYAKMRLGVAREEPVHVLEGEAFVLGVELPPR
jgi:hypothetical protein